MAIGMVHFIAAIDPTAIQQVLSLLIQIVIAAASIWSIFKKPKPPAV